MHQNIWVSDSFELPHSRFVIFFSLLSYTKDPLKYRLNPWSVIVQEIKVNISQDTVSQFWLRGLCPSSSLDTVYKLRHDLSQVFSRYHPISRFFILNAIAAWSYFKSLTSIKFIAINRVIKADVSLEGPPVGFFTGLTELIFYTLSLCLWCSCHYFSGK